MLVDIIDLCSSPDEKETSPAAKRPRIADPLPAKAPENHVLPSSHPVLTSGAQRVLDLMSRPTSEVLAEIETLEESGLVLLQASLVKLAGSSRPTAETAKQDLLPAVQRALITRKLEKMKASQAKNSARQELITKTLEGESDDLFRIELKRAGASSTTAVCRRVWGHSENIRKLGPNFTLRIPYNQAAEKFASPESVFAITNDVSEFLEYFNSRSRAGIAVLAESEMEVCLLPPGPIARAIIGVETLTTDGALGKYPLLLVVKSETRD